MNRDSFYITLPSNDMSLPDNTISRYTTFLPQTLRLDGSWEVALTEFMYTKSYFNILEDQQLMFFRKTPGIISFNKPAVVKRGYYDSAECLVNAINEAIEKLERLKPPKVILDKSEMTVKIEHGFTLTEIGEKELYSVFLGDKLEEILGLSEASPERVLYYDHGLTFEENSKNQPQFWGPKKEEFNSDARYGKNISNIKNGVHTFMVYSNVATSSIVGSTFAPLLRVVRVDDSSKFGDDVHLFFHRPYYLPVSANEISFIEINIKDETGEYIKFQFGRSVAVLHFRRVWSPTM